MTFANNKVHTNAPMKGEINAGHGKTEGWPRIWRKIRRLLCYKVTLGFIAFIIAPAQSQSRIKDIVDFEGVREKLAGRLQPGSWS